MADDLLLGWDLPLPAEDQGQGMAMALPFNGALPL
jgi:hypothetical protein